MSWSDLEIQYYAPDMKNWHVTQPSGNGKALGLLGSEPSLAAKNPHSGVEKQPAKHNRLNLVVFLFLSSRKHRQRTENYSFPSGSLQAKLALFLAAALVQGF